MPVDPPLIALPLILPFLTVAILLCLRHAHENFRHLVNIASCTGQLVLAAMIITRVSDGRLRLESRSQRITCQQPWCW
jgi:hypothetical protein